MVAVLISFYLVAVSISIGLLSSVVTGKSIRLPEAFSLGLGVMLVAGLAFYERGAFEHYAYFLAVFPVALAGWIVSGRSFPLQSNTAARWNDGSTLAVGIGLSILVLVTILTRLPVSNFLFEIGDAGSYVNSANSLARTGVSTSQFFPLNQILLGLFSSLGGFENTPYGVVFAGLLSIFYAYLFGTVFFEDRKWGVAVAFLVAFNALAMWFSRVPYSETLTLAVNLGALSFYVSARKGDAPVLNYVLFGLFVALASISRVTGIVWMMLLTAVVFVTAFQDRRQFRQLLPGVIIAAGGYLASVYVALSMGPGYYMGWQIKTFIPFIDSRADLHIFHVVWLAVAIGGVFLARRYDVTLLRSWDRLGRHGGLLAVVTFVVAIPLAVLAVSGGKEIMGITIIEKIMSGKWPQDAYFLWNYFTPLSLFLVPLGLVHLFRRKQPFADVRTLAVWLFAFLFLIIYYARVAYERPHDVYLYWDRYFLSETFVVFVVVLVAGLVVLERRRWTKPLIWVFVGVYFVYGAAWLSENRDRSYLGGAEAVFGWLQDVIPSKDSTVFLDAQYEGRWIFPNLRRSLMIPLSNSFAYQVNLGPSASPFSRDFPLSWETVGVALDRGRDVYVIRARKFDPDTPLEPSSSLYVRPIAKKTFSVETKSHKPGDVFGRQYKSFPLHLEVFKVRGNAVMPAEAELTGFHADRMWTDGNGRISGFERCSEAGFTRLRILTGGNHPWSRDPGKIAVKVRVNGALANGSWTSRTEYVATLASPASCINDVAIESSTFIPAELGINQDTRELGLDITRLKPEE